MSSVQLELLPIDNRSPFERRLDAVWELAEARYQLERAQMRAQDTVWASSLCDERTAARDLKAAVARVEAAKAVMECMEGLEE